MIKKKNKLFCIVGIGDHSNFKLLPALLKSGKKVVGLVSRSNTSKIRKFKRFSNINSAIKILPKETVFLISTPPLSHFYYIDLLLKKKRDFIVEKPMFTSPNQVTTCKKYFLLDRKIVFREAMMYRYTLLYKKAKGFLDKNFDEIKSLSCNFLLPNYSKNTFRNQKEIESSPLYDIGCYVIDFFVSINRSLKDFKIIRVKKIDEKITFIHFSFAINGILVSSKIGIDKNYTNEILIKKFDGSEVIFGPLFYGRSSKKIIKNEINNANYVFYDNNAFEKMFKENRKLTNKSKKNNYNNVYRVNKILYILSKQIKKLINVD